MAIPIDHRRNKGAAAGELNVYVLVLARLPFLVDDAAETPPANENATKISLITFDVMHLLQACFGIAITDVGLESAYDELQLSAIADVVAYYLLLYRSIALGAGNEGANVDSGSSTVVTPLSTFIKKYQSDNTSVEWSQLNTKQAATHADIATDKLLDFLFSAACDKLKQFKCTLCKCGECGLKVEMLDDLTPPAFFMIDPILPPC